MNTQPMTGTDRQLAIGRLAGRFEREVELTASSLNMTPDALKESVVRAFQTSIPERISPSRIAIDLQPTTAPRNNRKHRTPADATEIPCPLCKKATKAPWLDLHVARGHSKSEQQEYVKLVKANKVPGRPEGPVRFPKVAAKKNAA